MADERNCVIEDLLHRKYYIALFLSVSHKLEPEFNPQKSEHPPPPQKSSTFAHFPFSCLWKRNEFPVVAHFQLLVMLPELITAAPSAAGRGKRGRRRGNKKRSMITVNDLFGVEVTALIAGAC